MNATPTFRRRNVLDRSPGSGVPNMTPMVDVTLVILIFFMASATIAGPEWFLRGEIPTAPAQTPALALPSPVLRVEAFVSGDGIRVRGFGDEDTLEGVISRVASLETQVAQGLEVELDAGDDVAYEGVARLHAALIARGAAVRLDTH